MKSVIAGLFNAAFSSSGYIGLTSNDRMSIEQCTGKDAEGRGPGLI
jgi:hypothetical protein